MNEKLKRAVALLAGGFRWFCCILHFQCHWGGWSPKNVSQMGSNHWLAFPSVVAKLRRIASWSWRTALTGGWAQWEWRWHSPSWAKLLGAPRFVGRLPYQCHTIWVAMSPVAGHREDGSRWWGRLSLLAAEVSGSPQRQLLGPPSSTVWSYPPVHLRWRWFSLGYWQLLLRKRELEAFRGMVRSVSTFSWKLIYVWVLTVAFNDI